MAGTVTSMHTFRHAAIHVRHVCSPTLPSTVFRPHPTPLPCQRLGDARAAYDSGICSKRKFVVARNAASGSSRPTEVAPSNNNASYSESDNDDPNRRRRQWPFLMTLQSIQKVFFKILKTFWDEVARMGSMLLKERFARLCLFLLILPLLFSRLYSARTVNAPREVLYSSFVTMVEQQRVQSARLETASCRLFFEMKPELDAAAAASTAAAPAAVAPAAAASAAAAVASEASAEAAVMQTVTSSTQPHRLYVKLADKTDPYLVQMLIKAGVDFGVVRASFTTMLAQVLVTSLALWLPLIPLFFILRRMMDTRRGTRAAKKSSGSYEKVIFDDVAGVDAAKEELAEVVACLKDAERYKKLKVKMPSGVLLCGPPGTGKTLLARAVAGEAGVPFIAVSASEFVEMFVGRGAARIRELFAEARKLSPCVVFIDELDAVGGIRGRGFNDERDQTLNQLLTELDGFEARPGVLLLAATNRLDVLDPALLRPGRISRKVLVPLPDEAGRRDILAVHLRNVPMASIQEKVQACERIAPLTAGFSGAELANVVNEASLLAARKQQEVITVLELLEGVSRTRFGVNGRTRRGTAPNPVMEWLARMITAPKPVKQMGSV